MLRSLMVVLFLIEPLLLTAGEWSGQAALEGFAFSRNGLDPNQENTAFSAFIEPEYYHAWDNDRQSLTVKAFFRYDAQDSERTHWDLRELTWLRAADSWELRLGVRKVFWGVTESFHLVDIINQTDLVENFDGEEKLGQPMVNLAWIKDWGTIDVFLLTGFRERTFPGREGRLRFPVEVDTDRARYESGAEEHRLDGAIRYQHSLGAWDIGLSHFYGTSREPVLQFVQAEDAPVLEPYYPVIHQSGLDLQGTFGGWLLKLEGAYRSNFGDADFAAGVAGFEYTFFDVRASGLDIGLLAEYLWDERDQAATHPFADDVFLGTRLALNDTFDTTFLAGVVLDTNDHGRFWNLEASRRLNDQLKLSLELRNFSGTDPVDLLDAFSRDDHLRLELAYFW